MIHRNNILEDKTVKSIQSLIHVEGCYSDIRTLNTAEIIKGWDKSNKLLLDVPSPYLTPFGNNKNTEIVLHCPKYDINWRIECKSLKHFSSMIGATLLELSFVAKIKEDKYCLIIEGALEKPYVSALIWKTIQEKELEDKVWFGNLTAFEDLLRLKLAA